MNNNFNAVTFCSSFFFVCVCSGHSAAPGTFSSEPCGNQKADRGTYRKRILGEDTRGP